MEYSLDAIVSFLIFVSMLMVVFIIMTSLVTVLATKLALSPYHSPAFPTSLRVVKVREGYLIDSPSRCLVTCVIIKPEGTYQMYHGITPIRIPAKPSDWIVAFTYTSVIVKVGAIIHGRLIVSKYGVVKSNPLKPYVVVEGSSYQVIPNLEGVSKSIQMSKSVYFIHNGTIVLGVRG